MNLQIVYVILGIVGLISFVLWLSLKKIPKNRNVEIFISVVLDDYMFERYETLYTYFEVLKKTYGDLINLRITERLFSKDKKTFKSYEIFFNNTQK